MKTITVQNLQDITIPAARVGVRLIFPDGDQKEITDMTTDLVDGQGYFLTQVQLANVKKNGCIGKLTTWLKFRHWTPFNQHQEE